MATFRVMELDAAGAIVDSRLLEADSKEDAIARRRDEISDTETPRLLRAVLVPGS